MSHVQTGVTAHDAAVGRAEGIRQAAVAAASTQAAVRSADIACYQTALASARTNNCGLTTFLTALHELGVGQ
jgi:hypothetical protein